MNPGEYNFVDITDESRILGSFGRPRPYGVGLDYSGEPIAQELTIVPAGVVPSPPAVFRHPRSCVVPIPNPKIFIAVEWTSGKRVDNEPELLKVNW